MEIFIACSTSSSIAGFTFWKTVAGGYIWTAIGMLAVIASVVKPILKLGEVIQRKEKHLTDLKVFEHDLKLIEIEVRHRKAYDDSLHKEFMKVMKRRGDLVRHDPGSVYLKAIKNRCHDEVLRELPDEEFYIPPQH